MDQTARVPESLAAEFMKDAGSGVPEVSNRELACLVLKELDYESQLNAISDLLGRNNAADSGLTSAIGETDSFARSTGSEQAVNEWVDLVHASTYQSAAHSMAAVGMLVPLIESLFYQGFQGIRTRYYEERTVPSGHARSDLPPEKFWDCHKVEKGRGGVVLGILGLAEAIGFAPHLPRDSQRLLTALYGYRNKMFHFGLEWPIEERRKFAKRISDEGWDDWFPRATTDHEPWIFFMTDSFISDCLTLVHQLLDGFGAYCRGKIPIASAGS